MQVVFKTDQQFIKKTDQNKQTKILKKKKKNNSQGTAIRHSNPNPLL